MGISTTAIYLSELREGECFCRARRFLPFQALNPKEGRRGFELSILGPKMQHGDQVTLLSGRFFCTSDSPVAGVVEYTEEGCQRIGEQQTLRRKLSHIYSEMGFFLYVKLDKKQRRNSENVRISKIFMKNVLKKG